MSISHHQRQYDFDGSHPTTCHACTQADVPAFHSDRRRPPPTDLRRRRAAPAVADPRKKWVRKWNRVVLLSRGASLAMDPLFFYAVELAGGSAGDPCFRLDVGLAAVAVAARTFLDLVHVAHLCLQFRIAYVDSRSLVVGLGKLVWDPRRIAARYLSSFKGFWLDVYVVLPVPQVVIWFVVPRLLRREKITSIMTVLLVSFLFQFVAKVYHSIHLMKTLQKVTGYVFGSLWSRFILNIFAYFIASHIAGACWYILATERLTGCLQQQCDRSKKCNNLSVYCIKKQYYYDHLGEPFHSNLTTINSKCLDVNGPFNYGIYNPVLSVYTSDSLAVKILYPIFWGFLNLSSFGNELEPTSNWLELIFCCLITLTGLALFVTLIGNIQVVLHAVMDNKKKMQVGYRDMEWWMNRRQLPNNLRDRVRNFQRQSWVATGGQEDETDLIQHFPDGLRRDIRRFLCLDLVKKVPLFHILDDLILDNICDRLRPIIYSRGEKIMREGDPIQRMVFIVRGQVRRTQHLTKENQSTTTIHGGAYIGDELLTWSLRRPFSERLPTSSATFGCTDTTTEAFSIDAQELRYVVHHFRYAFSSLKLRSTARYHSSNWRAWAALVIQLAWRRWCRSRRGDGRLQHCVVLFRPLDDPYLQ